MSEKQLAKLYRIIVYLILFAILVKILWLMANYPVTLWGPYL